MKLRMSAGILTLVIAGGALVASAQAATPYRIAPLDRPPGVAVLLSDGKTLLDSSYGPGQIVNTTGPVRVRVGVLGPPRGAQAGTLRVSVSGIACFDTSGYPVVCPQQSWSRSIGRLNAAGATTISLRLPGWGCKRPRISVRLERPNGKLGPIVRWTPNTICAE